MMKNKKIIYGILTVAILIVLLAVISIDFDLFKTKNSQINCQSYNVDKCPDQCIVCPPCKACSSISCQTEEFCKSIGFDKTWYENIKKHISIEQVKEKYEDELMRISGVAGVGIGECNGAPCIKVYIEKETLETKNIPNQLEGFKIETEFTGPIEALPNPASGYCKNLGYKIEGSICIFPDNTTCEEWSFYRGKCGQKFSFCGQQGFEVESRLDNMGTWTAEYAVCVFNDSSECLEQDYLEGKCGRSECKKWEMSEGGCIKSQ